MNGLKERKLSFFFLHQAEVLLDNEFLISVAFYLNKSDYFCATALNAFLRTPNYVEAL